MGQTVERQTAAWVADLDDRMASKLAAVGLIDQPVEQPEAILGPFLDAYVAERVDVKPATKEVWGQVVRNLKEHFGIERRLESINDPTPMVLRCIWSPNSWHRPRSKSTSNLPGCFSEQPCSEIVASNPFAEVSATAVIRQDHQRSSPARR